MLCEHACDAHAEGNHTWRLRAHSESHGAAQQSCDTQVYSPKATATLLTSLRSFCGDATSSAWPNKVDDIIHIDFTSTGSDGYARRQCGGDRF